MKKYVVRLNLVSEKRNRSDVIMEKTVETFDEMEAFLSLADFVKKAKNYIKEFYGVDYEDEVDYIVSVATKEEKEEEEEDIDLYEDWEEDYDFGDFED